jgi:phage virion morphogenesis protein
MYTIEIDDTAANSALDQLALQLADMTRPMQEIGEFLSSSTKLRFGAGISPDGAAWAPKSEVTKAAYRARGDKVDDRPLFGPSGSLSSLIHYEATATSVRWGSPMIYAAVMQFGAAQGEFGRTARGGPIPWGNIPARPFLGLSDTDRTGVLEIIAEYLTGAATP